MWIQGGGLCWSLWTINYKYLEETFTTLPLGFFASLIFTKLITTNHKNAIICFRYSKDLYKKIVYHFKEK